MQSIVSLEVTAVDSARTARTSGSKRLGTGIVIDSAGLIVTAGDLIVEAETLSVTFSSGEVLNADVVAYDYSTGLGLVRANTAMPTIAIEMGESKRVGVDDLAMIIPASGEEDAVAVKVGKISPYSGGWEHIIDGALHTYPPSTNFIGAALVSSEAALLGIGTLVSIDIDIDPKIRVPGNVFIPVDTLSSVMGSLLVNGRSDTPGRPWIGLDVKKTKLGIAISSVTDEGPADNAGLSSGDLLIAVNNRKIDSQNDFFYKLWKNYKPGDEISLLVLRGSEYRTVSLTASDYYDWLQKPQTQTRLTELVD